MYLCLCSFVSLVLKVNQNPLDILYQCFTSTCSHIMVGSVAYVTIPSSQMFSSQQDYVGTYIFLITVS